MNLQKKYVKKIRKGIICGRFTELQEPGKRSPTFTICSIADVESLAPEKRMAFRYYITELHDLSQILGEEVRKASGGSDQGG